MKLIDLLGQSKTADLVLEGIGGSLPVRFYSETEAELLAAAENLRILANDVRANQGVGFYPYTINGPVEIIERLRLLTENEYNIVAFFAEEWWENGIDDAYEKIARRVFFQSAAEFAEAVIIHEHYGKNVISFGLLPLRDAVWNANDTIIYETTNTKEPMAADLLVLLLMKR